MDYKAVLNKFVEFTGSEQGLAQDLLAGQRWNFAAAVRDYNHLVGKNSSDSAPVNRNNTPASGDYKPQGASPTNPQPHVGSPGSGSNQPITMEYNAPRTQQKLATVSQPQQGVQTSKSGNPASLPSSNTPSLTGALSTSTVQSGFQESGSETQSLQQLKLVIPQNTKDAPKSPSVPNKKLQRGISKANCSLVDQSRQKVTEDEQDHSHQLVDTPMYTFVLPDLTIYQEEFRAFIEKDLLERTTMNNLEKTGRLNWWAKSKACSPLWAMATTGDGNCLLHAASLGMWGFHDRQLTLRKALYNALTENPRSPRMQKFKRRWRWQQTGINKKSGLVFSETEWKEEWKSLLRLASAEPRTPIGGSTKPPLQTLSEDSLPTPPIDEELTYESLEEFHVFVLANILHRPIIVVSDTMLRDVNGEAFAPISFGGIYLPLDIPHKDCQKSPLVLTFDTAHFSALVPMKQDLGDYDGSEHPTLEALPDVIPVTDVDHILLPVHFAVDPGVNWKWTNNNKTDSKNLTTTDKLKLQHQYLQLVKIPISIDSEDRTSANGLRARRNHSPNGHEQGSFGRKLKHFAKLEKSESGGSSGTISVVDLKNPAVIVGAKISEQRHQLHKAMIKNYIDKAKERFKEDWLMKKRDAHHQQKSPVERPRSKDDSYIDDATLSYPSQSSGSSRKDQQYQDDYYLTQHRDVYKAPLNASRSSPMALSQPHLPSHQPQGYQQSYQLAAPVESTVIMNKGNAGLREAVLQDTRRTGAVNQLVHGIHQPGPPSVYQQTAGAQTPNQPVCVPQVAHSSKVIGQTASQPATGARVEPTPTSSRPHHSPQVARSAQSQTSNKETNKKSKGLFGPISSSKTKSKNNPKGTRPCQTRDCAFYGTQSTDYLCSQCYDSKKSATHSLDYV